MRDRFTELRAKDTRPEQNEASRDDFTPVPGEEILSVGTTRDSLQMAEPLRSSRRLGPRPSSLVTASPARVLSSTAILTEVFSVI